MKIYEIDYCDCYFLIELIHQFSFFWGIKLGYLMVLESEAWPFLKLELLYIRTSTKFTGFWKEWLMFQPNLHLLVLQLFVVDEFPDVCQATPLLAGLAVASAALAGRYGIQAWQAFKARPPKPRIRKFYEGGFQPTMTKREAALILGIRLV